MVRKKTGGSLGPQLAFKEKKTHSIDGEVQPLRNKSKKRKPEHIGTEDKDVGTAADNYCDQSRETEKRPTPSKKERKQKSGEGQKSMSGTDTVEEAEGESKKKKRKINSVQVIIDKKAAADTNCDETGEPAENSPKVKKQRKPNSAESNKSMEANATTTTESATNGTTEDDINKKKKRKKKKKKKKPVVPKDQDLMGEKCISYLKEWKENRTAWKFQKLFQIWLIHNMLDDSRVPEDIFPTFLEYISGAKGQTVKIINERATKVIEEAEKNEAELDDPKLVRARSIIQSVVVD